MHDRMDGWARERRDAPGTEVQNRKKKKKAFKYIFNIQVVHLLSRSLHGLEKEKKINNILTVTALT